MIRIGTHDDNVFRARKEKELQFSPNEVFDVRYAAIRHKVNMSVNGKRTSNISYGGKIGDSGRIGLIVFRGKLSIEKMEVWSAPGAPSARRTQTTGDVTPSTQQTREVEKVSNAFSTSTNAKTSAPQLISISPKMSI